MLHKLISLENEILSYLGQLWECVTVLFRTNT